MFAEASFAQPRAPDDSGPADWLSELNAEQRRAVEHLGSPLLIIAGAGTGKTTTLCARVAWLLARGTPAERILLLTFTRRAAREMIARARALVEQAVPDAGAVVGGTFHSVAHRFVRRHATALGLDPGFGVLDPGDAADVIDLVREEHGHAERRTRFPRRGTLLDLYSATVNGQRPMAEVLAERFPWLDEQRDEIAALLKAYVARKRALGVLDFDDLLLYWRALALDDVIGPQLAGRFDHIFVDEYQDTNGLQVETVRALRRDDPGVTVVGDDFQAIYGFRAASADHIRRFEGDFPGATVITLERNYRSTQPILDAANEVAEQAEQTYPKRLRAHRDGGQVPRLVLCRDDTAEAELVCRQVLEAREQGVELRAQAVLSRTSHDSAALEVELTRRRIPFVKYGGLRYLEASHVKDFVALLRLAQRWSDELAWFRLLQRLDGVGPVIARRALRELVATGRERADAWTAARDHLPERARPIVEPVGTALAADRPDHPTRLRVERLREAIGPLISTTYANSAPRLADLDGLARAAATAGSLTEFLAELALDPPASSADWAGPPHHDEDYLVLSTIHSAKGLEWDAVHLLAVYDGNFPACLSAGSGAEIDEERRLLYVAMTRARRSLSLYVPTRYYHRPNGRDDAHGYGKPSRFLTDRVRACLEIEQVAVTDAPELPAQAGRRRIAVSVDPLFDTSA
ncbi:MAG TPA: ATP-dependent helicase [Gaiellales bacterium]